MRKLWTWTASGYLFALDLRATRSGQDWAEVLNQSKAQGVQLSVVVKDAARGIEAGVREVFSDAEQRDDCFHVLYEMNKLRRRLEQRAYGAIASEQEAEQGLRKIRAREQDKRHEHKRKIVSMQNFLELFRAWDNLRTRRWGRHKGTSAHECVTGTPVEDWLTLLGYPPPSHAALTALA